MNCEYERSDSRGHSRLLSFPPGFLEDSQQDQKHQSTIDEMDDEMDHHVGEMEAERIHASHLVIQPVGDDQHGRTPTAASHADSGACRMGLQKGNSESSKMKCPCNAGQYKNRMVARTPMHSNTAAHHGLEEGHGDNTGNAGDLVILFKLLI